MFEHFNLFLDQLDDQGEGKIAAHTNPWRAALHCT
jgi:hypothetical protein